MGLQNLVWIDKASHTYWNKETGDQLISWSRFIDNFFPKFDAEGISKNCAGRGKYKGMTQADVLKQWKEKGEGSAGYGTRIHDAIEYFGKNFSMKEGTEDLEPLVKSIYGEYKDYYKTYSEEILFTKHGIANTLDQILMVDKNTFDLEDYKTNNAKGIEFIPGEKVKEKWCKYPIEHLPNCNYTKYALQLSMNAYTTEETMGWKARSLAIRFIPPDDKLNHIRIPVPYMKRDIELLISEYIRQNEDVKVVGKIDTYYEKDLQTDDDF